MLTLSLQKITANKETGLTAWRTHSEAAFHIVKNRGRDMFRKNQYSVRLFNAVRLDIVCCSGPHFVECVANNTSDCADTVIWHVPKRGC